MNPKSIFQCELCGKIFRISTMKSWIAAMRRHRKQSHADERGAIRYHGIGGKKLYE